MFRSQTLATVALSILASTASAQSPPCTTGDFKGVYSAVVSGSFLAIPGFPAGPTDRVGRVQVDGNGASTITAVVSFLGQVAPESYSGTYTIAADCTANVILRVPFPGVPTPIPLQFSGVLASGGRQMSLLLVNPQGTDLRILLSKQRKPVCSAGDLSGDYALNMAGTVLNVALVPSGPYARVGKVTFDGVSTLSASVNTSYAGLIQPETFKGTYTVDATCILKATFAPSVELGSWFGVLSDTIGGANIIDAGGGTVVVGTLTSVY
jgi:hypothetical protein